MPIRPSDPFFWRHYEGPIILVCVRWYLRLPLSYRQVADLMTERGLGVHASCIWRWVQVFGPELDKRCRPHLKPTNKSYRVDETYIKVKGQDRYLYRAVDSTGQTIDFRSPPSAMRLQPSDSFVRFSRIQPIFSPASSTWTRTPRIRPRSRS